MIHYTLKTLERYFLGLIEHIRVCRPRSGFSVIIRFTKSVLQNIHVLVIELFHGGWDHLYTNDIDRLHTLNLLQSLNCRFDKSVSRSPVFKLFNFGFTAQEDNLSHIEPGPIARSAVRPPACRRSQKSPGTVWLG